MVGPKGQVVIPQEIRQAKGIRPGMTVIIDLEGDKIVMESKKSDLLKWVEEKVTKDGKVLGKIDWDKSYEEEFEDKWGMKRAVPRR